LNLEIGYWKLALRLASTPLSHRN